MPTTPKALIIFDLDGTLAPSKSKLEPATAVLFTQLLRIKTVAIISGGAFAQFETQVLSSLSCTPEELRNLILVPTSGTRMYTWDNGWHLRYEENFSQEEKAHITTSLREALQEAHYSEPAGMYGPALEDRGSQITFSACGQQAPIAVKEAWDPTREKREAIATILRTKLPGIEIRIGGSTSIDITRAGVNKRYGIQKLREYTGISEEAMLFIGDALFEGGNDFPVTTTGVECISVTGPEETRRVIEGLVKSA